ncbi:MAG: N-6 DNA methylase [Candidatus Thorarchaeota archaeon]
MSSNNNEIEKRLWSAADKLRANSNLTSTEYSTPVLGLIFLKWADYRFSQAEEEFRKRESKSKRKRETGKADYQAKGVMYLPDKARFSYLLKLPEKSDIGKAINDAMRSIEEENEDLRGVLPMEYNQLDREVLFSLLRDFNSIPIDVSGDAFGKVYEYFLGKFAMAEGRGGGEFFTPTSIVRLIVEIIEPFHGRIFDPACGSGGMFVQSARFLHEHKKNPSEEISIYGQESKTSTVRLCKMNLAVHGLAGDIREANSYYEDVFDSIGKFDFVMANPPFNVDEVNKERIKDDPRFGYGIPSANNANYLWIQIFQSALNQNGRAGFVMANSASDAGYSELELRKKIIKDGIIDVIVTVASNFFYTVTLPCTLWFIDKRKPQTQAKNSILFIDARRFYHQIDRAHREFTDGQIEFIANIVRLYKGDDIEYLKGSQKFIEEFFPDGEYKDIPGLCKATTLEQVEYHKWSLNPGRYVGVPEKERDDGVFEERMLHLNQEFEVLVAESEKLSKKIVEVSKQLLEQS